MKAVAKKQAAVQKAQKLAAEAAKKAHKAVISQAVISQAQKVAAEKTVKYGKAKEKKHKVAQKMMDDSSMEAKRAATRQLRKATAEEKQAAKMMHKAVQEHIKDMMAARAPGPALAPAPAPAPAPAQAPVGIAAQPQGAKPSLAGAAVAQIPQTTQLPKCADVQKGTGAFKFPNLHHYCSKWCNTGKWGCGIVWHGTYSCDCSGCNKCPGSPSPSPSCPKAKPHLVNVGLWAGILCVTTAADAAAPSHPSRSWCLLQQYKSAPQAQALNVAIQKNSGCHC